MKTSLIVISLLLAAGIPGTIVAGFVGVNLPAVLDTGHVLCAYLLVSTLLIAFADYSRAVRPLPVRVCAPQPLARSTGLSHDSEIVKLAA